MLGLELLKEQAVLLNYLALLPPFSVLKIISLIAIIVFIPITVPASVSLVTPASKTFREARLHSAPWRAQLHDLTSFSM